MIALLFACVPYEVLAVGDNGGSDDPDPTDCTGDVRACCATLVADAARSAEAVDALLAAILPAQAPIDTGEVDFATTTVVAITPAGPCPNTGYRLHVGRVEDRGDTLVVHAAIRGGRSGGEEAVRPYAVLAVPWTGPTVTVR